MTPASLRDSVFSLMERMRSELASALDRPRRERKWGFSVRTPLCTGCRSCETACRSENRSPPGVSHLRLVFQESGAYPKAFLQSYPLFCLHCQEPPCGRACPTRALSLGEEGIVIVRHEACIGCRECIPSCPWGVMGFDFGLERYRDAAPTRALPSLEPGMGGERQKGVAAKCHACLHRVDAGRLPACTEACPTGAIIFGNRADPNSLVSLAAPSFPQQMPGRGGAGGAKQTSFTR